MLFPCSRRCLFSRDRAFIHAFLQRLGSYLGEAPASAGQHLLWVRIGTDGGCYSSCLQAQPNKWWFLFVLSTCSCLIATCSMCVCSLMLFVFGAKLFGVFLCPLSSQWSTIYRISFVKYWVLSILIAPGRHLLPSGVASLVACPTCTGGQRAPMLLAPYNHVIVKHLRQLGIQQVVLACLLLTLDEQCELR